MARQFTVEVEQAGEATVLAVSGELDLASCPTLEEAITRAGGPAVLVLDLRSVDFMDSSGLAVLVRAHQRTLDAGQRFGVINGSAQVQRLLTLTGVDERIAVADSLDELLRGERGDERQSGERR